MMNDDQCWDAVVRRDRASDGAFFLGVVTTGVYCRPSCPARRPLRKNVRFYATPEEAERDGLRACLRCRPKDADAVTAKIRELCRYIEANSDNPPDLADLAARAGLSRFHLQRSFKAATGVTPKQYLDAFRMKRFKGSLRENGDIARAVYEAGFGSPSRVYERAGARLGMTPDQYRRGGRGAAITYATVESPLGLMMIGATERGICSVQFGETDEELLEGLKREFPAAEIAPVEEKGHPRLAEWGRALNRHLAGSQPRLDLPLDIRATAFQMRVWSYLQSIPYGEVQSYSEVAAGIGQSLAVRAVARACATNPVPIAIPCHRVVRGTGELGGYRYGAARKRTLIERERAVNAGSTRPGR